MSPADWATPVEAMPLEDLARIQSLLLDPPEARWDQVLAEHQAAFTMARRIAAAPGPESSTAVRRLARTLVALDEAMRAP